MTSVVPPSSTPIAELTAKFKPKLIQRRADPSGTTPATSPTRSARGFVSSRLATSRDAAYSAPYVGSRAMVPPLTSLALEALVNGFHNNPSLAGIPAKFSTAIASKLPLDLAVTTTAPNVEDEVYWRRVCLEHKGWTRCEVAEHGGSWKQLFLERNLTEVLENFGLYAELPSAYDDEFCRPAIDSTHPRWTTHYPKAKPLRPDSKPTKERFSANTLMVNDVANDSVLAASAESGWPHLEHLKQTARANFAAFRKNFAWSNVDKSAFKHEVETSAEPASKGVAATTSPAAVNPLYLPFSMAAEHMRAEAEALSLQRDDHIDATATGDQLREFLLPEDVETFKKFGRWPRDRRPSVLSLRQKELNFLLDQVQASEDFVFNLILEQLPSHIDLELLFSRLPNLTSLQLTYGMRHLGMRYDRTLFGMRLTDVESLSRCLRTTPTLTRLSLPCNMIDDNMLMVLMAGLLDNRTITHLDLSHNSITSAGLQLLTKLLKPPCILHSLNLADNKIDEKAGKHIAKALRGNETLTDLNLRLNDLGDEGGRAVLDALAVNTAVTILNLSSNRLGTASAATAATLLANPACNLCVLDLTGNRLDESDAEILHKALTNNHTITTLDLRGNVGISERSEYIQGISQITRDNEVKSRLSADLGMSDSGLL